MSNEIKSAEEKELDREELALRTAAEEISPARPEDATFHDDTNPAGKSATATDGKAQPDKNQRPGDVKQPAAAGTEQPGSKADDAGAKKPGADDPKAAQVKPKDDKANAATDESKLTPFQKERRRLDRQWETVNAENDRIRKEKDAIAQERAQLAQQKKAQTDAPKPQSNGLTAEDYDQVAKDFEAEGKTRLAEQAKAKAAELRKQAPATDTTTATKGERFSPEEVETMKKEWAGHLEVLGRENPDLTKEGTPLRTRVAQLLKSAPVLSMHGAGIVFAVEHAKLAEKAAKVDELTKSNAELEAEVTKLRGLTSLPSGGAAPGGTAKKFDDLTEDEQEAELRKDAATAERQ